MRKVALAGGLLYLLTFAASFPQLKLFAGIIDDPTGYISTPRSNTAVLWGSWLEVVTAVACIGTAVALYPATRRVSRTAAIGFVTSRVVEATLILVGVMCVLSVVTLQRHFAGATGAQAQALGVTGEALVAMRQWTFLLGPGLMAGINGLFLGYVMYRGRLVPRIIPTIGLIGAPHHPDVGDRDHLRGLGPGVRPRRALHPAHRRVGVLPRRVADRQGLQAGPCRHRAGDGPRVLNPRRGETRRSTGGSTGGPPLWGRSPDLSAGAVRAAAAVPQRGARRRGGW